MRTTSSPRSDSWRDTARLRPPRNEASARRRTAVNGPKRVKTRRLRIRWQRTILAAVIMYVLVTLCTQEVALFKVRRQVDQLDSQIAVEKEKAAILDAEIVYRSTDEYIELAARRELGMVLPGEIPVVNGVSP